MPKLSVPENFLEKIDFKKNDRENYAFETFVLNLLKVHLEASNKEFHQILSEDSFDAFAPDGIDNISGPTQIEVKFNFDKIPISLAIKEILEYSNYPRTQEFDNLLIITPKVLPSRLKNLILNKTKSDQFPFEVFIWSSKEINNIAIKYKNEVNNIAKNLFSLRLESVLVQAESDWQEEREEKIDKLKEIYSQGQISFFLGAGVSSSAGMPDWNTLLNSLFVTYLTNELDKSPKKINDDEIKQIVNRLNAIDEPSTLMAARYLRKGLSDLKEAKLFTTTITDSLYNLRDKSKRLDSDLIRAISSMCMPKRTGVKVKSVVTYNFDDLIERQLETQSILHHSIYTENDFIHPDELPIYHVHGFLPEDHKNYEALNTSTLVFSEEGYHKIYMEPYHWSNLVQLSNLRENRCLMVGLSMTDPNLRRLLDISSRHGEKTRHFAFMKRLTDEEFLKGVGTSFKNIAGAKSFLNRHHVLNEELMRELGVSILWFTDYDEIPILLQKISNI